MGLKIYDHDGAEQSLEWLHTRYGPVNVRVSPAGSAFRVVELHESIGPAVYIVTVFGDQGQPLDDELVARHWPYREWNPGLDPLPEDGEWFNTGVYGPTSENGDIGFGTGGGDYYHPENGGVGASSMWVLEYKSDCIENIGTLGGTEHAHLNTVFQWVEGTEPPLPEDECPDLSANIEELELVAESLGVAIAGLRQLGN